MTQQIAQQNFDRLAAPMRAMRADFLNKANASVQLVATCYDKMCEKIGGSYPIPQLSFTPIQVPHDMIMPGAIIAPN
jgi:hypothetical protein